MFVVLHIPESELLRLGELQSELEHRAGIKVDVTLLNRLYDKNPAFAQKVATTGEVVLNRVAFDEKEAKSEYVDYRVMCLKYFQDSRRLRHMMNEAFERRLKEKKFGNTDTYRDCIEALEKFKIIDATFSHKAKSMVGLRNILVHDYVKIDMERLYEYLNHLDDFEYFVTAVKPFLNK